MAHTTGDSHDRSRDMAGSPPPSTPIASRPSSSAARSVALQGLPTRDRWQSARDVNGVCFCGGRRLGIAALHRVPQMGMIDVCQQRLKHGLHVAAIQRLCLTCRRPQSPWQERNCSRKKLNDMTSTRQRTLNTGAKILCMAAT
jgi:hypothetical protein